jgi:hypothetical protein
MDKYLMTSKGCSNYDVVRSDIRMGDASVLLSSDWTSDSDESDLCRPSYGWRCSTRVHCTRKKSEHLNVTNT